MCANTNDLRQRKHVNGHINSLKHIKYNQTNVLYDALRNNTPNRNNNPRKITSEVSV